MRVVNVHVQSAVLAENGNTTLLLSAKSSLTGKPATMQMEVPSLAKFQEDYADWDLGGKLVQNAFPYLNAEQREFLMTGITPEEWEQLFGHDDEVSG